MLPGFSSLVSSCVINATNAASTSTVPSVKLVRGLAVISWGRNVEGQCGIESSLLVLRPTPILELHDSSVTSLVAGKLNSGAVTAHGEAWTWGDGKSGKLGHGTAEHVTAPNRVEGLVGRAAVRQLALGDHHTLFLDSRGGIWVCGENKEGQCGLGTPPDLIAAQHRRAYHDTMRQFANTLAEPRVSREQRAKQAISALMGAGAGHAASQHAEHSQWGGHGGSSQQQWGSGRSSSWQSLMSSGGGSSSAGGGSPALGARSALHFRGMDLEGAFAASGLQAGQQATPLRIGRDQHPLWAAATAGQGGFPATSGFPDGMREVLSSGLEAETVVGVAASRYFSAALTAAGEVWTFGACYNGSLGSERSWSTSAQRVAGALATTLDEHGGARQVVSGGSFCAALTAGGKVVLWGKVPGGEDEGGIGGVDATAAQGGGAIGLTKDGVGFVQAGRLVAGVVPGLLPITHVAAGLQHLLLSDGTRVWLVGRALDASGNVASSAPWRKPALVLTLPHGDAVAQLVAGPHSSGVVSARGDAWVWGRLLDRQHVDNVMRRHPNHALGCGGGDGGLASAAAPMALDDVEWDWAGFGGRVPARLEGLGGPIKALALGGWHAMATVE